MHPKAMWRNLARSGYLAASIEVDNVSLCIEVHLFRTLKTPLQGANYRRENRWMAF